MATRTIIAPPPNPAISVFAAPYAAAGPLIAGTSITPNNVGTAVAKTFTIIEYNRSFYIGTRLRASAVGFTDTWMEGVVTAWDGSVVTIAPPDLAHNASATIYSNWTINVAGQPGTQGIQGPVGPQGPSGGATGPAGPPGAPGSVWRNGVGVPLNSLGADGDYYLNDTTDDVYLRTTSIYSIVANIKGSTGAAGAAGPVGPTGPQGIIPEAPTDGGYYARRNSSWQSPPGGGNVSVAGTPTAGQLAQWTSLNTITGITSTYGNISSSGTPAVNQWAQWVDATHIQGIATASMPFVQKAGDTMSGGLIVSMTSPIIDLRKTAAAQYNQIFGRNGTAARWSFYLGDNTAESGNNAGSDFKISNYDDTGNFISNALSITRSTGLATVVGDPTVPLGIATKQYVDIVPNAGLLSYVSTTSLKFVPFRGSKIKINGVLYNIPSAGIAGLNAVTGVYVNGVAGQNLAAATVYLVFAFVAGGGVITADFRTLAANSHSTSSTAGNVGTEVLFAASAYDDTRTLIGIIRTTTGTVHFADSLTQRFVRSWFNRVRNCLAGAALSGVTTSNTTSAQPLGSIVEWVNFSDDTVDLRCQGCGDNTNTAGGVNYCVVLFDGGPQGQLSYSSSYGTGAFAAIGPSITTIPGEGYHISQFGAFVSSGTASFYITTYGTIG